MAHRRLLDEAATTHAESTGAIVAYSLLSVLLVAISGLMAGLTLGLLSLDKVDLEVLKRSGSPREKRAVQRVQPVLCHPHWLLVTLLLVNSLAMEALPIFLDRVLNAWAAILVSVTAILCFGEILPQAVCKRYGLYVGASLAWLVRGLMWVTAPVSWPISKLLDWLLGSEEVLFSRGGLRALVTIHAESGGHEGDSQRGLTPVLSADEVTVIQGALDLAHKTAAQAMTPLEKVFMLSSNEVIDRDLLGRVIGMGHSRVPVYEGANRQNILGLILVKELVLVDLAAGMRVVELRLREVPFLSGEIPLYDVLKIFRMGRAHMACLTRPAGPPLPPPPPPPPPPPAAAGAGPAPGVAAELELTAASTGKPASATIYVPEAVLPGPGGRHASARSDIGPGFGGAAALAGPPKLATLTPINQELVGIITIEDVLEELLQAEILDETDQYVDNLQTQPVLPPGSAAALMDLPPDLRKFVTRVSMTPPHGGAAGRTSGSIRAAVAAGMVLAAGGKSAAASPDKDQRPRSASEPLEVAAVGRRAALPGTSPAAGAGLGLLERRGAAATALQQAAQRSPGGVEPALGGSPPRRPSGRRPGSVASSPAVAPSFGPCGAAGSANAPGGTAAGVRPAGSTTSEEAPEMSPLLRTTGGSGAGSGSPDSPGRL